MERDEGLGRSAVSEEGCGREIFEMYEEKTFDRATNDYLQGRIR